MNHRVRGFTSSSSCRKYRVIGRFWQIGKEHLVVKSSGTKWLQHSEEFLPVSNFALLDFTKATRFLPLFFASGRLSLEKVILCWWYACWYLPLSLLCCYSQRQRNALAIIATYFRNLLFLNIKLCKYEEIETLASFSYVSTPYLEFKSRGSLGKMWNRKCGKFDVLNAHKKLRIQPKSLLFSPKFLKYLEDFKNKIKVFGIRWHFNSIPYDMD